MKPILTTLLCAALVQAQSKPHGQLTLAPDRLSRIDRLLQGYVDAPKDFQVPPGGNYNTYFPGHSIAMPPPLQAGQVTFDDGAPQTLDQYSKDVTSFMMWAAEPHMVARKRLGFQVMIFLIMFAGLMYFTKKKVWSAAH